MSPEREAAEPQEEALPERLHSLARYIAVVADELDARKLQDIERVHALEADRRAMEQSLRDAEQTSGERRLNELLHRLLDSGLQEIADEVEIERRKRDQWAALDDELSVVRRLAPATRARGLYLRKESNETKVDLRL